MSLLFRVTIAAVCIIVTESKERTASLVVLPPLVIGYDELYHDSQQENGRNHTEPKDKEQATNTLREELDTVQDDTIIEDRRRRRDFAQRDVLLDVKGRRRNYRKFMRGRKRIKN